MKLHLCKPLWFYILRETDAKENGERLGPLGGRIVAEVLIVCLDKVMESPA
ncbi:hypothetical protein NSMM_380118 [Nitrosomonas mobilis]|uniref:Uncharacterized protein n=1 Tax=Nitrosomonas mobilis TaxID=51642 RepID=A0A1G5SE72_9PROT|nr:hypothetical protein NSMM_380118 [Nitrosomonas mobilis]